MTIHQLFDFICDKKVEFIREGNVYTLQVLTHPGTNQPHSHVSQEITEIIKSPDELINSYLKPACMALDRAIKQLNMP